MQKDPLTETCPDYHRGRFELDKVSHLDEGQQRALVEFLELGSDVHQINLRATHHDPG